MNHIERAGISAIAAFGAVALAAHERVRNPTATVAIRRLEKLSLVQRSRDVFDMRAVLVAITPRGAAMFRDSLTNRRTALAAMLRELCESDLRALGNRGPNRG